MKTKLWILAVLVGATVHLAAADGSVTWDTYIYINKCPGGGHGPTQITPSTRKVSSECWPDSWTWNTNLNDIEWTPRTVPVESYHAFASGNISGVGWTFTNQWVQLVELDYGAQCCVHTGRVCVEIRDIATFSGGLIPTNELRTTIANISLPANSYGLEGAGWVIGHEVDGGPLREVTMSPYTFGNVRVCPSDYNGLRATLIMTNRLPWYLQIRSAAPGTTGTIRTNASLGSTNWNVAAAVTFDGNGEADVNVANWAAATNAFFFRLDTTNAP